MKCGIRSQNSAWFGEKLNKFCISDGESHHRQSSSWLCGLAYNKMSEMRSVCASFMHNLTSFKTHLLTEAAGDVNLGIGQFCACHNCLNASIKNQKWQNVVQHNIVQKLHWELRASPLLPSLFGDTDFLGAGVNVLRFFGGLFFFLENRELFFQKWSWKWVCCLLWWHVSLGLCCF